MNRAGQLRTRTSIINWFGEITVDVVDRFLIHDRKRSAFSVANFLQIVTRFWHPADAGGSGARCQVN